MIGIMKIYITKHFHSHHLIPITKRVVNIYDIKAYLPLKKWDSLIHGKRPIRDRLFERRLICPAH